MSRSQRPTQVGWVASDDCLHPPSIKHLEKCLHPYLWGTNSCQQSSTIPSLNLLPLCGFTLPTCCWITLNNPAVSCWHFYVVSFPSNKMEPGKLYLKRGGKEVSIHSICCRVCPSTYSVWPSPSKPCSCANFYCEAEKYVLSSSRENVTLKFPAFLSRLCSVLGRDGGNLRWPRRENSRDLCLNCLNS